jgi:hypothetical protein
MIKFLEFIDTIKHTTKVECTISDEIIVSVLKKLNAYESVAKKREKAFCNTLIAQNGPDFMVFFYHYNHPDASDNGFTMFKINKLSPEEMIVMVFALFDKSYLASFGLLETNYTKEQIEAFLSNFRFSTQN